MTDRLAGGSAWRRLAQRIPMPLQLMLMNGVLTLGSFVTGVMLARALGPAGRGGYAAVFTWAATISNVAAWGTHMHLARRAAQDPGSAAAVYRTAYRVALVSGLGGTLLYIGGGLIAVSASRHYDPVLVLVGSLIILFSVANVLQIQIELGRSRFASYNIVRALFTLANFLSIGVLFAAGVRDLLPYIIAVVVTAALASTAARLSIRRSLKGLPREPAPSLAETYRAAAPLGVSILFSGLVQQMDKLLVSLLFAPAVLGVFVVAATLGLVQQTVGEALSQMFFARAAAVAGDTALDVPWLSSRLRQTILIYAGVCAGMMLVVPPLVPLVYGPAYAQSATLLYILLPATALQGMVRPFEETLRGFNQPRRLIGLSSAIIGVMILAGAAAWATASIAVFSLGLCAAFAVGLLLAATILARHAKTSVATLLLPRGSDIRDLWSRAMRLIAPGRGR